MKTNFSLLFYMKKQKNYTKGIAPIYMRITVNGKRAESATGRYCEPERWNSKSGRSIGTKEDSRLLNSFLDQLQNMVYEAHGELLKSGYVITAESIKNRFMGREDKSLTLLQAITEHNQKVEALVGKEFVQGTLNRYKVLKKHLEIFLSFKYDVRDLDMRNVDIAFLNEFDYYLRSEKSCANNYTVKMIKNLGKIINISLENGQIHTNPFAFYKGRTKKVDRYFLNQEEIQIIANKKFTSERLDMIRDVFLFCCFTGLAYADVQKLQHSHISKGFDGERWIIKNRQKTNIRSAIPLLPSAVNIIEKYKNHPVCLNKGLVLPVPSNQKMNEYLKEIEDRCEIGKKLTSHIARHTFATTVTLLNGVPIESVSQMLGHTNIRTTQHYAKILDIKVGADMALLKNKLAVI
ncbi:site-specific integrase [Pedobacter jejuensis]|uniref:Site-specific integrase n=2 Tax=Pedobacter jejuensis TaxID=1268550 RepID=A0A3N0BV93_9SPHI|nr:site-specific integrase [Pedobacter jejuensis]RNL52635.1 site-specific integrase [Pedobacter jejuensis]